MTKVCVPTATHGGLDDLVGEHFGRVPTYTIYDSDAGTVEIVDNTSEHAGGSGLPGEILSRLGIDVLLCSGLGRRAIGILTGNGIEICADASGTAGEAIEAWKKGNLSKVSEGDACEKQAFHDRH
jgi:predicted Fe-Mo cluster-binding NifX family protein